MFRSEILIMIALTLARFDKLFFSLRPTRSLPLCIHIAKKKFLPCTHFVKRHSISKLSYMHRGETTQLRKKNQRQGYAHEKNLIWFVNFVSDKLVRQRLLRLAHAYLCTLRTRASCAPVFLVNIGIFR